MPALTAVMATHDCSQLQYHQSKYSKEWKIYLWSDCMGKRRILRTVGEFGVDECENYLNSLMA